MKSLKFWVILSILLSIISLMGVSFIAYHLFYVGDAAVAESYNWDENGSSDVFVPQSIDLAGEEMPLQRVDVFESLKKELIINTYLHSHTIQLLKNSPRIFKIIEPILKEEGVPDDFKYLAVIESQLNPLAVSYAGAVGVWQFLKSTGKEYGLEINDEVDERYSIEASTRAAAAYLKAAYRKFGSWTLAAASYNGGMGRVTRQMKSQKQNNFYDLLFAEETNRYIYRIVALKQIMNMPHRYNFHVNKPYKDENVTRIVVNRSLENLTDFAAEHEISYKTLKRFNPWLRSDKLKNRGKKEYTILIPEKEQLYRN